MYYSCYVIYILPIISYQSEHFIFSSRCLKDI